MATELDMEKAYDNWIGILFDNVTDLDFCDRLISQIMQCVITTSYKIIVNLLMVEL